MSGPLAALTLVTLVGCALSAGAFFAFSGFVMKALGRLPAAEGIAAMQAINVAAVSFAFMLALFGTAAACLALGGWALAGLGQPYAPYLLAGSALYLAGRPCRRSPTTCPGTWRWPGPGARQRPASGAGT